MTCTLNAVSAALAVHPRTILRLTTGQPNPYWAEGYDPEVDLVLIAAILATTVEALNLLLTEEDHALKVQKAAAMMRCKAAAFYRKNLQPDWQVGRVKRYSFLRLVRITAQ